MRYSTLKRLCILTPFIFLILGGIYVGCKVVVTPNPIVTLNTPNIEASNKLWDFGILPYAIDTKYFPGYEKIVLKKAMRHWEASTCLKFIPRTSIHKDFIFFTGEADECSSSVGNKRKGQQRINIGKGCLTFDTVLHEIGHAVGFQHEHQRPDRDDYVTVIRENIEADDWDVNFEKVTDEEAHSEGEKYDFDSIMHYDRNSNAINTSLDAIIAKEDPVTGQRPTIGKAVKLSPSDIRRANKMYKCPTCGGTLLEAKGNFGVPLSQTSEEHVGSIMPQMECEWRIIAQAGNTVNLIVNLEGVNIDYSKGCEEFYLEVRDGHSKDSPLLHRLCGDNKTIGIEIKSSGNGMLVTYVSKRPSNIHPVFTASYEILCGGEIESRFGDIESPNFPNDYFLEQECKWKITVPEGYHVALTFNEVDIEYDVNCDYDFLEVSYGSGENQISKRFCGTAIPNVIMSSSNILSLRFVSDVSNVRPGFSVTFTTELNKCAIGLHDCTHTCTNIRGGSYTCGCEDGLQLLSDGKTCGKVCGGILIEPKGTITSPGYPNEYPSDTECWWSIFTPRNYTRIIIRFSHFEVEGSDELCGYDSLLISSKLANNSFRHHGKFCETNRPPPKIYSDGNYISIIFKSDKSTEKTGFSFDYTTGPLVMTKKNDTHEYPCSSNCKVQHELTLIDYVVIVIVLGCVLCLICGLYFCVVECFKKILDFLHAI